MKFFTGIGIFLAVILFCMIGGVCVGVSIELISLEEILNSIEFLFSLSDFYAVTGAFGGILILAGALLFHGLFSDKKGKRSIAFTNPEGEVTVSLSAIEEHIAKSIRPVEEIKEAKVTIKVIKRGLETVIRVFLWEGINVPEVTEGIQVRVRSLLQEMLGLEENIIVKVNVGRIASRPLEKKRLAGRKEEEEEVPFEGRIKY